MKKIKVALAGNPNSGKTTIFNNLTGLHQHIGNWPGVTVEKKEGNFIFKDYIVDIVDLPGIYSISATTIDEKIARDYLLKENPDIVVCVLDSSNLERNLYLVIQLLEMKMNLILDLNMMDSAISEGIYIDEKEMCRTLNCPVVKTIANKNKGTEELKNTIISAYESLKNDVNENYFFKNCPSKNNCSSLSNNNKINLSYGKEIDNAINEISEILKNYNITKNLKWLSIKLLEEDQYIIHLIKEKYKVKNIEETILKHINEIEKNKGQDITTIFVETRYNFIKNIMGKCIANKEKYKYGKKITDKIDKIVLNKYLGIPLFLLIMFLMFKFVFVVGDPLIGFIESFFEISGEKISLLLNKFNAPEIVNSLFVDGIIGGIGSVLVFLPNIMLLFFAISLLEDSGYMARAAFIMDKFMQKLGLHGKSFIPMILGFGCNVPAIMATRTLESKKDRILTILVNPLMSCSARLPIYILFTSVFFIKNKSLVVFSLYLTGIILAIILSKIFKNLFFKDEIAPLIMELPPYRLPILKNILIQVWQRSKLFIFKAGTIIFGTVVLIWILSSLPVGVEYASENSLIGKIGKFLSPIFRPAGFGFWQASVALIFGILAKEVVVGTFGTLFAGNNLNTILPYYFTPLSAYSFMIMTLIYIPCIATIAAIKRETNWKWTLFSIGYSFSLGWILSVLVFQIGILFAK